MPIIYQDCLRCGREFYIKESEQKFWRDLARKEGRDFHLPKRCYKCRKERREEDEVARNAEEVWEEEDGYQRRTRSKSDHTPTDVSVCKPLSRLQEKD